MATSSVIPTVKAQLVTKFTTALAAAAAGGGQLQTSYAWLGAATKQESVFLGPAFDEGTGLVTEGTHAIPTIKAGRKQRQEEFAVPATVWTHKPGLANDEAATCEARAFAIFALLEGALADDPTLGLAAGVIQSAAVSTVVSTLKVDGKGWKCELSFVVVVKARLT